MTNTSEMNKTEITYCAGGAFAVVSGTINGIPVDVKKRGGRLVLVNVSTCETIPGDVPALFVQAYKVAQAESREHHAKNSAVSAPRELINILPAPHFLAND